MTRNAVMGNFWKDVWEKRRIRICQAGGALLLWIAQPRSNALFLLGLAVALLGEAVRLWAAGHIRKGTELARRGPYAMVRHPLYLGSLLMSCGFALICTSPRHGLSTTVIWAAVLSTFRWLYPKKMELEERDLESTFGEHFRDYRARVPAFWPERRLWKLARRSTDWSLSRALSNKEHRTLLALLGLALVLRLKMTYRI